MQPSPTLFIILTLLTLAVLVIGLLIMAKGGKVSKKYTTKLMAARVIMQFITIAIIAFMFFLLGRQ